VKLPTPHFTQGVVALRSSSNVPGLQDMQSMSVFEPSGACVPAGHAPSQCSPDESDVKLRKKPAAHRMHCVPGSASSSYWPSLHFSQSAVVVDPIEDYVPISQGRHLVGVVALFADAGS
jgi:hypothetical protein